MTNDETIGERVEKLERAARNMALQLNGDLELGITGRLGEINKHLERHNKEVSQLREDLQACARSRQIDAEDVDAAMDYQNTQSIAKFEIIYRRVFILTILFIAFSIAQVIALFAIYVLVLEALSH